MKLTYRTYLTCLVVALLATVLGGCKSRHEEEMRTDGTVSLSLCLPVGDFAPTRQAPQRRVMGDPGTTETFAHPNYAYIFLLKQTAGGWVVYDMVEETLDNDSWSKQRYHGSLRSESDSIFRYTKEWHFLLTSGETFNGRVYAIASAVPLTFNRTITDGTTLSDLLDLKFDASSATVQGNVQHIYTTPYNYLTDGAYYGSFSTVNAKVPMVNLMLYHVAAKVDLKWNVEEEVRINRADPSMAVRLTSLNVRNLFNGNAYCFRPMENTVTGIPDTGYNITNIVQPADEGLWWEGRYYFYTLLYTVEGQEDYFPLQLTMRTNGSEGTGYRLTIKQPVDITDPFVPWIRGNLLLTQPLTNTSETRIAG